CAWKGPAPRVYVADILEFELQIRPAIPAWHHRPGTDHVCSTSARPSTRGDLPSFSDRHRLRGSQGRLRDVCVCFAGSNYLLALLLHSTLVAGRQKEPAGDCGDCSLPDHSVDHYCNGGSSAQIDRSPAHPGI